MDHPKTGSEVKLRGHESAYGHVAISRSKKPSSRSLRWSQSKIEKSSKKIKNTQKGAEYHVKKIANAQKLLRDMGQVTSAQGRHCVKKLPKLTNILKQAAMSHGAEYKDNHDSRIDLIVSRFGGNYKGGQVDHFHSLAKLYADQMETYVSRSTTYKAIKDADIVCAKVKPNLMKPSIAQHYAARDTKTCRQVYTVFSKWVRMVSSDAKQNFKCNSDDNSKSQRIFQVREEKLETRSWSRTKSLWKTFLVFDFYIGK